MGLEVSVWPCFDVSWVGGSGAKLLFHSRKFPQGAELCLTDRDISN